jgi:hypothetical protein
MIHYDFSKIIKYNFYKITIDHHNSDTSTVIYIKQRVNLYHKLVFGKRKMLTKTHDLKYHDIMQRLLLVQKHGVYIMDLSVSFTSTVHFSC